MRLLFILGGVCLLASTGIAAQSKSGASAARSESGTRAAETVQSGASAAQSESDTTAAETEQTGVRVRHAEINGQIFFASEREGEDEMPAPDVLVQIRNPDDNSVLHETRTDTEGKYTFPKLDVGAYRLVVGSLKIKLTVEPESAAGATEQPKMIIIVLPKKMAMLRPE